MMMIIIPEMITTRHTGLDQHKPNKATESCTVPKLALGR
jgi:hypothetical protein